MSTKVIIGHVKLVDDEGNVLETGVSLIDLYEILDDMRKELKKISFHLQDMTELGDTND